MDSFHKRAPRGCISLAHLQPVTPTKEWGGKEPSRTDWAEGLPLLSPKHMWHRWQKQAHSASQYAGAPEPMQGTGDAQSAYNRDTTYLDTSKGNSLSIKHNQQWGESNGKPGVLWHLHPVCASPWTHPAALQRTPACHHTKATFPAATCEHSGHSKPLIGYIWAGTDDNTC